MSPSSESAHHAERHRPPRLVVLLSGSGTNLQALLDAIATGRLAAEIALVVSNRKGAFGLQRAERAGIPTHYVPLKPYIDAGQSREEYDRDLARRIEEYAPDLVVLAGWMHIFSPGFVRLFAGRLLNLHPALPGTFPGAHAIREAFDAYQRGEIRESGCMVHRVTDELDAGAVVAQAVVPFVPGDTLETFEERMHHAEHRLIVEAVQIALTEQRVHDR